MDTDPEFDGLHICSVCGDRETTTDVCWSCREQAMIDESIPIHHRGIESDGEIFCLNCGAAYDPDSGEFTAFGGWFCGECAD